jgi:hypothetical protein
MRPSLIFTLVRVNLPNLGFLSHWATGGSIWARVISLLPSWQYCAPLPSFSAPPLSTVEVGLLPTDRLKKKPKRQD